MTDWQVGMKAVCISDFCLDISRGTILTVSGTDLLRKGTHVLFKQDGGRGSLSMDCVVLMFTERQGGRYLAKNFRPVVKRSTDISVFQAMLNTVKEPERELAR